MYPSQQPLAGARGFVVGAPPSLRGLEPLPVATVGIDPLTIMSLVGAAAPMLDQLLGGGGGATPQARQAQQVAQRAGQQLAGIDLSQLTRTITKQKSELGAIGDLLGRAAKRGGQLAVPDVAQVVEERSKGLLGPDLSAIVATLNKADAEGLDIADVAKTLATSSKSKEVRSLASLITAIDQGRVPEGKVLSLADSIIGVGRGVKTPQAAQVELSPALGGSIASGLAGLLGTKEKDPLSMIVSLLSGDGKGGGGLGDIISKLLPGAGGIPGITKPGLPAATPGVPGIDLGQLLGGGGGDPLKNILGIASSVLGGAKGDGGSDPLAMIGKLIGGVAGARLADGRTVGLGPATSIVARSIVPAQVAPYAASFSTVGVWQPVYSSAVVTVGGLQQTTQRALYAYTYPNGYTVGIDPLTIMTLVQAAGPLLGGGGEGGGGLGDLLGGILGGGGGGGKPGQPGAGGGGGLGNLLGGILGGGGGQAGAAAKPGIGAIGNLVGKATEHAAKTISTVVNEGAIPLPLGLKLPINPLDSFDDVGQVFSGKPPKTPLGVAAKVVKTVADPIIGVFKGIGDFFGGLFGGGGSKPCKFDEKGNCASAISDFGLAYGTGDMDCCNPVSTGRGVIVTGHSPGYKKFPGGYFELPAGDYFTLQCGPEHADRITPLEFRAIDPTTGQEVGPCAHNGIGGISGFIVPEGFKIQAFSAPMSGTEKSFGPGVHKADKLNDKVFSARVRGAWTYYDSLAVNALRNRTKGWITSEMNRQPKIEECVALVLADPQRPIPPDDFATPVPPYTSFWSEGWRDRLAELGLLDTPEVKSMLQSMGISTGIVRKTAQSPEEELAQLLLKVLGKRKVKFTTSGRFGSSDIPVARIGWGAPCYPGAIFPGCQSIESMAITAHQPPTRQHVRAGSLLVPNDDTLNLPAGTIY